MTVTSLLHDGNNARHCRILIMAAITGMRQSTVITQALGRRRAGRHRETIDQLLVIRWQPRAAESNNCFAGLVNLARELKNRPSY